MRVPEIKAASVLCGSTRTFALPTELPPAKAGKLDLNQRPKDPNEVSGACAPGTRI